MNKYSKTFLSGLLAAALAFGCMMVELVYASPQGELNKGVIMLTPSGGKGFDRYYPTLKDRIIQDHAFFTFGWATMEPAEGQYNWSEIDALVAESKKNNKKFATAIWVAAHSFEHTPAWLYYDYNVRRVTAQGAFIDFENASRYRGFTILPSGSIVSGNDAAIAGKNSLMGKDGPFLSSEQVSILKSYNHSLGFDYRFMGSGTLTVELEATDGTRRILWQETRESGAEGSKMIFISREDLLNYKAIRWIAQNGGIAVDSVSLCAEIPGEQGVPVAYPNYFDPVFKEKYENFIAAFYERYKDEPTVAALYVGGYGRWDEASLGADPPDPRGYNPYATADNYYMTNEQWISLGYTDEKYVDHIRWCGQIFQDYFGGTGKNIIMQSIAFDVPGDLKYVNWSVINYAVKMGFGIKVNGLSERMTEWGSDTNQYSWISNRYKHSEKLFYLEEGTQVNNIDSAVVGHPLSLMNRILIDSIDYIWVYENDIYDPYVRKYLHFLNEQAGSALVNKMYSMMGAFPYYSSHARTSFTHYNLWTGIFTRNSDKLEYGAIDGVKYAETGKAAPEILLSIDDRQKWSGMYGNVLTIDYYDEGTGTFDVIGYVSQGTATAGEPRILGSVRKTGTSRWKSISYYGSDYVNSKRNGGIDMPHEIGIKAIYPETVKVRNIELNYVPVWEYRRTAIKESSPEPGSRVGLTKETRSFVVDVEEGSRIAEILIPVSQGEGKNVKVSAAAYAYNMEGEKSMAAEKDLVMPGDFCYLPIPVSNAPSDTVKFVVEIRTASGTAYTYEEDDGEIAFKTAAFLYDEDYAQETVALADKEAIVEARKDFAGLTISGKGDVELVFSKRLPDGQWVELFQNSFVVQKTLRWEFEPQTAGVYKIEKKEPSGRFRIGILPLARIDEPNKPFRYNLGRDIHPDFIDAENLWKPVSGLKNMKSRNGVFTAELDAENPVIQTAEAISVKAQKSQIFHIIMKNGTSSPLMKLYWKTDEEDYSEKNSAIIPSVANDSEFREYSWPIGQEKAWEGTITGLRFLPVSGHTETGEIAVFTLDLRNDNKVDYDFREALDITALEPVTPIAADQTGDMPMLAILAIMAAGISVAAVSFGITRFAYRRKKKSDNQPAG